MRLPWAEPRARFTTLFERLAIDVLREMDISGATRILRLSWDEAWELKRRAVERGRARKAAQPPARLGVDETAAARGLTYLTLVCDLDRGTVEYRSRSEISERGAISLSLAEPRSTRLPPTRCP